MIPRRSWSADLPISTVTEIEQAFGGYDAITERMFGRFIDHLDGERMRSTLPSLIAALDAARELDLLATPGYGLCDATCAVPHPSWGPYSWPSRPTGQKTKDTAGGGWKRRQRDRIVR